MTGRWSSTSFLRRFFPAVKFGQNRDLWQNKNWKKYVTLVTTVGNANFQSVRLSTIQETLKQTKMRDKRSHIYCAIICAVLPGINSGFLNSIIIIIIIWLNEVNVGEIYEMREPRYKRDEWMSKERKNNGFKKI